MKFLVLLPCAFITSCVIVKFVRSEDSGPLKLFLRTGDSKHYKDDVFLIPGKGCKSPTLLIEGGHQRHAHGKTNILMQSDCDQDKSSENSNDINNDQEQTNSEDVIKLPIPIPVFRRLYHIPLGHHSYQNTMEWQPYSNIAPGGYNNHPPMHFPLPLPMENHFIQHNDLDPYYFNSQNDEAHLHKSFIDKVLDDVLTYNI